MTKSHSRALSSEVQSRVVLGLLLVALFLAFGMQGALSANTAVETRESSEIGFTSISPRGLSGGEIIPASCESGVWDSTWDWAHPDGNNSGTCAPPTPPPAPANACTSFSQMKGMNFSCYSAGYPQGMDAYSYVDSNSLPWMRLVGHCYYFSDYVTFDTGYVQTTSLSGSGACPVGFGWTVAGSANLTLGTGNIMSANSTYGGSYPGSCSVPTPTQPGIGNACPSAPNSCGVTQSNGTIQCDGSCSSTAPANPSGYGSSCTSAANACGSTNTGTINCSGACTASTPANPSGYGSSCTLTSAQNACSQTTSANTGTINCSSACTGTPPPPPAVTIPGGNTYDAACTSAPNVCEQTQSNGTWQCNGTCSSTPPPDSNCTYTLTITTAGTGGGTAGPAGTYNYGQVVALTNSPGAGSTFTGWSGDADCSDGSVTINAAKACTATFTLNTYTISATAGSGGTISPASRSVNYGSNTTFTVTPNAGYTASATGCGGSLAGTTYTTGAITGACTVSATFTAPDLTITDSISPQTATQDSPTVFSTTIRNIGSRSTGASFNNFMQVATNPNGGGTITDISPAVSMPALAVSGTGAFSKSYTFASNGSYSLRVCADKTDRNSAGVIPESDDNNNCGGWENIVVSSASCVNGANNYPACNTCTLPLVWNGTSCVVCNGGCGPGPSCNNGATNPPSCSIFTPTATLSVDDNEIDVGQSTILRWNSTNATSCTGTGFATGGATASPPSGVSTGVLNSAGTYNYQVVCSGAGGDSSPAFASVEVLAPSATISASPSRVTSAGDSSTISWNATGVGSCTVSGPGLSSTDESGSQPVTITAQSTYTITCTTSGSPVTDSVTVNVLPVFQEF